MAKSVSTQNGYIALEDVSKSYKNVLALSHVSFDLRKGDIFGYIGPNGSGKTTTIKIIVGLLKDFQGDVRIKGNSVRKEPQTVHKFLGYLPQNAAFQDWRTVEHALTTFGQLSGLKGGELRERIRDVLGVVGISEYRHTKISHLSGGTVQKLGMAQAILHGPELLILDEPMAGLDPASRYQFKAIFKELSRRGTTIFFSSHILSDVQDLANRIGILNAGRLMHLGTTAELEAKMRLAKQVDVVLSVDSGRWRDLTLSVDVKGVTQIAPNRFLFELNEDVNVEKTIDAIIRGLLKADCKIRSIFPVTPTLEELYVRYLGGGAR